MGFSIQYCPLFQANLWHGYFLHPVDNDSNALDLSILEGLISNSELVGNYNIGNVLAFIPSLRTRELMAQYKMRFRATPMGFSVWTEVKTSSASEEGPFQPFVPYDQSFKLVIGVQVKAPDFYNFTDLPLSANETAIYYFSNQAGHEQNSLQLLSQEGGSNYVSDSDRLPIYANTKVIDVSDLEEPFIRLVFSNELHTLTTEYGEENGEENLQQCLLQPRNLPSGKYQIEAFAADGSILNLNDFPNSFYWNSGDIANNTFAVIEIFHFTDGRLGNYNLLSQEQQLRQPTYTLWWRNRITKWRYVFDADQPVPDADCDVDFENGNNNLFITKADQPLVDRYRKICYRKAVEEDPTTEVVEARPELLLPNPTADRIYPVKNRTEIFSEIYMGRTDFNKLI